ncbi:vacuolar protein sorting protein vps66 [Acrodontium crateriforme]|uniref:Vacuolar protein sorting protein vps66 n=1 Tax=Acrodontium crateriforme TaxID=150365 RepID=A0AAQ3M779_9PEZI|nr:vacuolar protein sorting protein vps66 [Acrodontium crateriforme]
MEKYGQYRDKSTGIAPFFSVAPPASSPLLLPWHILLFTIRIPFLIVAWLVWLLAVQWMPAGSMFRKATQWCLLGIPGVWWIDLQVDGVRRGSLASGPKGRLPGTGTIIASSFTSPLDVLYLAAIFDPIFTLSEPKSRKVRPISLESALASCFAVPNPLELNSKVEPTELAKLTKRNPNRVIVVFPESTTGNGRGILRFSPSLLSALPNTKIYPVSLRYSPPDVVTPMPGWIEALKFIWRLNSRQTHCIRVRIGGPMSLAAPSVSTLEASPAVKSTGRSNNTVGKSYDSNFFDDFEASPSPKNNCDDGTDDEVEMNDSERRALDSVADSLARLGRVKRVGLGVQEKAEFVHAWSKRRA